MIRISISVISVWLLTAVAAVFAAIAACLVGGILTYLAVSPYIIYAIQSGKLLTETFFLTTGIVSAGLGVLILLFGIYLLRPKTDKDILDKLNK